MQPWCMVFYWLLMTACFFKLYVCTIVWLILNTPYGYTVIIMGRMENHMEEYARAVFNCIMAASWLSGFCTVGPYSKFIKIMLIVCHLLSYSDHLSLSDAELEGKQHSNNLFIYIFDYKLTYHWKQWRWIRDSIVVHFWPLWYHFYRVFYVTI